MCNEHILYISTHLRAFSSKTLFAWSVWMICYKHLHLFSCKLVFDEYNILDRGLFFHYFHIFYSFKVKYRSTVEIWKITKYEMKSNFNFYISNPKKLRNEENTFSIQIVWLISYTIYAQFRVPQFIITLSIDNGYKSSFWTSFGTFSVA